MRHRPARPELSELAPPEPREQEAVLIEAAAFRPAAAARRRLPRYLRPLPILFGAALVALGLVTLFMFTAKSVQLEFDPPADSIAVDGRLPVVPIGGRHLAQTGAYSVRAEKAGYQAFETRIEVGEEQNQEFSYQLEKLPGVLEIRAGDVRGATVTIDGEPRGAAPLENLELEPGPHVIAVAAAGYLPYRETVQIEGAAIEQTLDLDLVPGWAPVRFSSQPSAATVRVDGESLGRTPLTVDLGHGSHEVVLELEGFKPWQTTLEVAGDVPQTVAEVIFERADGRVSLRSSPTGASVTVAGSYRGQTPLELALAPGKSYAVALSRAGYETATRTVHVEAAGAQSLDLSLQPIVGVIQVHLQPADAELYVNGVEQTDRRLSLPAVPQRIEARKPGFAPYEGTVTPRPGFAQVLDIELKTSAQIEAAATPELIRTSAGQQLRLIGGKRFTMGASRREQGRRANENLRPVEVTRPFYIGVHEVTNAGFRAFLSSHSSGIVQQVSLDNDDRPAVRVTWAQAARYCNWLSQKESLAPVYVEKNGALVASQPIGTGYRLPTEAEWELAARFAGRAAVEGLKYPWGMNMPPPANAGNFADAAAAGLVRDRLDAYDDGYAATAPGGKFAPNAVALFDLGGNVAEWVHDYYAVYPGTPSEPAVDPLGPAEGQLHVIRGSSWMHGGISELRLSYRDSGDQARPDLGFRIARFAE